MKKTKFSEGLIVAILKVVELGDKVGEIALSLARLYALYKSLLVVPTYAR